MGQGIGSLRRRRLPFSFLLPLPAVASTVERQDHPGTATAVALAENVLSASASSLVEVYENLADYDMLTAYHAVERVSSPADAAPAEELEVPPDISTAVDVCSPTPLLISEMPTVSSLVIFQQAQVADQPRIPWDWAIQGMALDRTYIAVVKGKWWSELTGPGERKSSRARDLSHIGRIMETELGERLVGERACAACRKSNVECWAYSREGARQVKYAGSACARCRVVARPGGCSNSSRRRRSRSYKPITTSGQLSYHCILAEKRNPDNLYAAPTCG